MSRPDGEAEWLGLQAELDELERTDPDVAAAAQSYDRMVERVTGRHRPEREPAPQRRCVWCGSTQINLWKSWNVAGEWTCDECTPSDPTEDGEGRAIPYMLENTPEEFERVRNLAWPAAPAAEADDELREQALADLLVALYGSLLRPPNDIGDGRSDARYLLTREPLQRLVAEAAEARRLRETVARVEALDVWADSFGQWTAEQADAARKQKAEMERRIRRTLDGTDG